jgi:hypothetical protein
MVVLSIQIMALHQHLIGIFLEQKPIYKLRIAPLTNYVASTLGILFKSLTSIKWPSPPSRQLKQYY